MRLFLNIVFLLVGLFLLIKGADFFVSGSSSIAKKLKISPLIIGLTIVAFGTSAPELSVSISSALSGSADIAVGNVIGSNIFNLLMVLGVSAVMAPIVIKPSMLRKEFPFLLMLSVILLAMSFDVALNKSDLNFITRGEGIILVILFILYIYIIIRSAKKEHAAEVDSEESAVEEISMPIWKAILLFLFGLGLIVFGGECVTSTSKYLAMSMGMSETLVGLTIVALGTSLPELVTSIVAAKKGENELALGNVIGSNIFNFVAILGITAIVRPLGINSLSLIDMVIMTLITFITFIFASTKNSISRKEGFTLLVLYAGYMTYIILRNYL